MTSENVSKSQALDPTKTVPAQAVDDQLINELVDQFLLDRRGLRRRIRLVSGGHELGHGVSHLMSLP